LETQYFSIPESDGEDLNKTEVQTKARVTESIEISDDSSDGSVDAIKNLAFLGGNDTNLRTEEISQEHLTSKEQSDTNPNNVENSKQEDKSDNQLDHEKPEGSFFHYGS
jgi:hypothetical protein